MAQVPEEYRRDLGKLQADLDQAWKIQIGKTSYVPFYSFRVKRLWNPCLASTEFYNNWIAFCVTLGSIIATNSLFLAVVGSISVFLGNMLTHYWYGYNRYPNVAKRWFVARLKLRRQQQDNDQERTKMDEIRNRMAFLYRRRYQQNSEEEAQDQQEESRIRYLGGPVVLVNEIVVFLFCSFFAVAILIAYIGAVVNLTGGESNTSLCLLRCLLAISTCIVSIAIYLGGHLGCFFGSLFWAIVFVIGDVSPSEDGTSTAWIYLALKLLAGLAMLLGEEYYTALLFRKSVAEFLKSALFNVFYDFFAELGDVDIPDNVHGQLDHAEINVEENISPNGTISNGNATRGDEESPNVSTSAIFARAMIQSLNQSTQKTNTNESDDSSGYDC